MTYLNNQILALNTKLEAGILTLTKFSAGIVKQVFHKGKKKAHIDTNGNIVHFDDKFDVYFYHKILSETEDLRRGGGVSNNYQVRPNLTLIVYSKIDSSDYFRSKLAEVGNIEITSIDYDSYKIFADETELTEYKFEKEFIFAINYIFKYDAQKCLTL